jgi:hypothetical protein
MKILPIALASIAFALLAIAFAIKGSSAEPMVTCVLSVATTRGTICIKPDGNITVPDGSDINALSRKVWTELAKTYAVIKNEKCI